MLLKRAVFAVIFSLSAVCHESVASTRLNFTDTGNPQGIPVVLVHAFPLNQAMWDDQVEALNKFTRVITFDIRALGKSESDVPYTMEFVVDDLIGLLDRLKIDKAVICGLSMGGFVALRAIERNPERFLGVVLADTKSEADSDKSKLGRYEALKAIQDQGLPAYVDSFLKSALAPSKQLEQSPVFVRAKHIAESNSPTGVAAAILALTSRMDTTAGLSKIQMPALIMNGQFDSVIPLPAAKSLHDKIKGSIFFLIPNAGHLSNLENPEAFNEHLVRFLKGLKR